MALQINKTHPAGVTGLRKKYLNSLVKFQDIFLEFVIYDSVYYQLSSDDQAIGYAIVSTDEILVEFYIEERFSKNSHEYFLTLVQQFNIKGAYCKSFDHLLLNCCLVYSLPYKVIGYLYRDFTNKGHQLKKDLSFRYAGTPDLPFLQQQNDEVFEPKSLLKEFVERKGIIILEQDDQIAGCGFLTRVVEDYPFYDLGVWVDPAFRRQGYAVQIILYMMQICRDNGWLTICGCDAANTASQGMLSKIGFISHYKLIEFDTTNVKQYNQ
ncbi:MAG: GNAT family N-acetyltransferase [Bacteroidales bacterium]|nr:GNAT family N-acetyltransferase [Bacteroidales bacterium]